MTTTITSSKSSKPASICWQVTWAFSSCPNTLFLSDFIGAPGLELGKAFRLGAETDVTGQLVKLCCYVNSVDLAQLGFTAREVTCTLEDCEAGSSNEQKKFHTLKCDGDEGNNKAFFSRVINPSSPAVVYKELSLTFRLFLSRLVKQYAPHRFDVHLGQQLWTAAVNGQMTDVVFQVGDKTFRAHKFILAARSPVFRAMFDSDMVESRTGEVQIVDIEDPDIFEQFLLFLYSGQLAKPLSKQLGMVAEKYQVETLTSLCRAFVVASEGASTSNDGLFSIVTSKQKLIRQHSADRKISRLGKSHLSSVTLLHTEVYTARDVGQQVGKTAPVLSEFFRYKVEHGPSPSSYDVRFYSIWRSALGCRISAVNLLVLAVDNRVLSEHAMEPFLPLEQNGDDDQHPIQIFQTSNVISDHNLGCFIQKSSSFSTFRFVVHFASTVDGYQTQLRDSLFAQELCDSAVNKERTDVEFRVGDITFPAHRALLASRCPALAALIPAAESPSGVVPISNVDPNAFDELLNFLYTGLITAGPEAQQEHLLEASRAFQMDTLSSVAKASGRKEVNLNRLSEFLMSYF